MLNGTSISWFKDFNGQIASHGNQPNQILALHWHLLLNNNFHAYSPKTLKVFKSSEIRLWIQFFNQALNCVWLIRVRWRYSANRPSESSWRICRKEAPSALKIPQDVQRFDQSHLVPWRKYNCSSRLWLSQFKQGGAEGFTDCSFF